MTVMTENAASLEVLRRKSQPFTKIIDKVVQPLFSVFFNREPFKSRLEVLTGAGIAKDARPCGCILWATHQPEKQRWILIVDYFDCKEKEHVMREAIEGLFGRRKMIS